MSWKPSNQPGKYDNERVAQVGIIEKAIDALALPVIRSRQLLAIVSALEVQVEVGGDSPEVNRLLRRRFDKSGFFWHARRDSNPRPTA
ncbi:MAG TPA: hypothetical protein VFZ25_17115 [Chloroflexota bacterium]|nr:hypothetical protein [Chloroflexota bacterium]